MGKRQERDKPSHSLDEAKLLAQGGKVVVNKRARQFIANRHGRYDISAFISELFGAISPSNFVKSMELEKIPGIWADVYSGFEYEGENWYVKFFIDAEGTARLNVMSANWDGYIH